MRKYLLPNEGTFFKANLHCHTELSDGGHTAEFLKKYYMDRGYSIIAYTDHDIVLDHTDLSDDTFLALNGCEVEVNENDNLTWREMKTCHICCIKMDPTDLTQVCYHRDGRYLYGNAANQKDRLIVDEKKPDFVRCYSHEGISAMMKEARDSGCYVTYNHPVSSLESYPDYVGYQHMHALEIHNSLSVIEGYQDYCPHVYDDMLRAGKRISCVAGDDTHSLECACLGYTVIKAPELKYGPVIDALLQKHFYVSQGPEIHGLWIEDGVMHVECSEAELITFTVGNLRTTKRFSAKEGGSITSADFRVDPDFSYVRVSVLDKYGKAADTNAYFVDELLSE